MAHSIATRTGDDGTTGLLYGQRVPKDHPQIEAVGSLDELNAAIGLAKATLTDAGRRAALEQLQRDLIAFMGEIACAQADTERFSASKFRARDRCRTRAGGCGGRRDRGEAGVVRRLGDSGRKCDSRGASTRPVRRPAARSGASSPCRGTAKPFARSCCAI